VPKSVNFLNNLSKDDPTLKKFAGRLEDAFNYFEKYKQLPVVLINDSGEYSVNDAIIKKDPNAPKPKHIPMQHRTREITKLVEAVHQWPEFPGGGPAFMKYLEQLGKDLVPKLPEGITKAFVQVEFIVDTDGVPVNFKVLRGMKDEEFIDELIARMEKMPTWQPAILHDKAVPKKMVQTVTVETTE
jgi:hypothetical protein